MTGAHEHERHHLRDLLPPPHLSAARFNMLPP
jgi:hypothetical protein